MDLKLPNPSILRVMAAEHLQTKIVYEFVDNELLATALTAAHRRDEYSPYFDGAYTVHCSRGERYPK